MFGYPYKIRIKEKDSKNDRWYNKYIGKEFYAKKISHPDDKDIEVYLINDSFFVPADKCELIWTSATAKKGIPFSRAAISVVAINIKTHESHVYDSILKASEGLEISYQTVLDALKKGTPAKRTWHIEYE